MAAPGARDNRGKATTIIPGLQVRGDTVAGRYRIERLLGSGSSGFVVAARHIHLQRPVTLKLLTAAAQPGEAGQRAQLMAAHRAAALRGPYVAHVIDTGFLEDGMPFIASERLEGRTLADELAAQKQLPIPAAIAWTLQACAGLAEAHAAGLVHGNLKPQNVFLAKDEAGGELPVVKILDLGTPWRVGAKAGDPGAPWFGSPAYLAPEQLSAPDAVDARADVWALGVLLYEMIAGTVPFSADNVPGMLVAVASDEPAMLAAQNTPFPLARIVRACISRDPSARPADVATLARQLAPFAGAAGEALAKTVETTLSSPPPPMTIDGEVEGAPADPAAAGASVAAAAGQRAPKLTKRDRATGGESAAFRRRRAGAIATVAGCAVLAVVGLTRPTTPSSMRAAHAEPAPAQESAESAEGAPPMTKDAPQPSTPKAPGTGTPAKAEPGAPEPVEVEPVEVERLPDVTPARRHRGAASAGNVPAARLVPRQRRSNVKPALPVRDNPYGRGVAPARPPGGYR